MPDSQSVSLWLEELQAGDATAAGKIWQRYFDRLVAFARKRLQQIPRRVADEEDIALSAFDSFFTGVREGRFPELRDRNNLWRILVVVTARKVNDQIKNQTREKRGGGRVRGESAFLQRDNCEIRGIDHVMGDAPTPEFSAVVAEETHLKLDALNDEHLREIAILKLEGFTTEDIASKLACTTRTVERKLQLIRHKWALD